MSPADLNNNVPDVTDGPSTYAQFSQRDRQELIAGIKDLPPRPTALEAGNSFQMNQLILDGLDEALKKVKPNAPADANDQDAQKRQSAAQPEVASPTVAPVSEVPRNPGTDVGDHVVNSERPSTVTTDAAGNVTSLTLPGDGPAESRTWQMSRNPNGEIGTITAPPDSSGNRAFFSRVNNGNDNQFLGTVFGPGDRPLHSFGPVHMPIQVTPDGVRGSGLAGASALSLLGMRSR